MDPVQIVLIVLVLAGIWAVVELALTIRRTRDAVGAVDKAISEVNDVVTEARPVIAKLDGALDDLAPALTQVEPLLQHASVAVEALSADLVEVNGVLRDVAQITGTVSTASDAVSGIADAASEKVQQLLGKKRSASLADRALEESVSEPALQDASDDAPVDPQPVHEVPRQYYTYVQGENTDER